MKKKLTRSFQAVAIALIAGLISSTLVWAERTESDEHQAVQGSLKIGNVSEADYPGLAKVSFEDALRAASGKDRVSFLSAELEKENGALVYEIELVRSDKKVNEVIVDAGNGKVLSQKMDPPDQEDEENEEEKDAD